MKRLFLIPAFLTAIASGFAQTECSQNNPIYKFDNNNGSPKEIHTLGSNPEFPFLRNLSSPGQLYSAIKKNNKKNTPGMSELNGMLMEIGMANGTNDLQESSITTATIPSGTDGNMGYRGYGSEYSILSKDTKAWKISGTGSCFVYIIAQCGNAFFPKSAVQRTACLDVPVTLTADTKEVTLEGAPPSTTTEKVYVYYDRRHRKRNLAPEFADLNDPRASNPILVNTEKNIQPVPQSYKITVNTPEDNVRVCPDVSLNVQANINVEKESEYTGYYPAATKNTYKLVSKRVYRIAARKLRKAERKEARVAHLTKMPVNSHEGRA
jgi:hypothetical protein